MDRTTHDAPKAFAALVGRTCDGVGPYTRGGAATFQFGDALLHVECLWRVLTAGSLRLTAADHGHPYGLATPVNAPAEAAVLLRGRRVVRVVGGSIPTDVTIVFDGDVQLEVLTDSSGYEPWAFSMQGVEVHGLGGGKVAE